MTMLYIGYVTVGLINLTLIYHWGVCSKASQALITSDFGARYSKDLIKWATVGMAFLLFFAFWPFAYVTLILQLIKSKG